MSSKQILVVLGMHRSGTSAVARGLEALGVNLGDALIPGGNDNEKGFWEDAEIVALNQSLQEILGYAWYGCEIVRPLDWSDQRIVEKKAEAVALLERKIASAQLFGFKDPRTATNIEFWLNVFQELGIEPRFVIVLRNPLDVAASLEFRNGLPLEKSLLLWFQSLFLSLKCTQGKNRVVVSFDQLLENPKTELNRMASALELPSQGNESSLTEYVEHFLDEKLRHHRVEEKQNEVIFSIKAGPAVIEIFELAKALSVDAEVFDSPSYGERLSFIESKFEETSSIIELYLENERNLKAAQLEVRRARESLMSREDVIKLLEHKNTELEDSLARLVSKSEKEAVSYHIEIERQAAVIDSLEKGRLAIESSLSWKLTKPARVATDLMIVAPWQATKRVSAGITQSLWDLLPVGSDLKRDVKRFVFTKFEFALKYSGFYRDWIEHEEALENSGRKAVSVSDGSAFDVEIQHRKYEESQFDTPPAEYSAKLIAFYLPQFHQIPENDAWWGEGFTEWTNVKPALPQYNGHYQPHIPGELGYYDLTDPEVLRRQTELARRFGVGGFCFYFYWFSGTRLLEKPLLDFLANRDIDFPFCLCWANENWSRTWDGKADELLIAQHHTPEDDIQFISYLAKYLTDRRYIRVNGKPLIMVYRPSILPSAQETVARWRSWCRDNGIGEIFLVTTHSFEAVDPGVFGFDAAVEFPPNNTAPAVITDHIPSPAEGFEGIVYDWRSIAVRSEEYDPPEYTLFRCVNPSWDNTARRKNRGAIFAGSNPRQYQKWLTNAINDTCRRFDDPSERLVFINAWNEWAEGAHLEPDQAYGYAYLNATRRALTAADAGLALQQTRRVLLVAHDAHPHGAQTLALHMAKYLSCEFGFDVDMVVLGDGILLEQYQEFATVHDMAGRDPKGDEAQLLATRMVQKGHKSAICNTTVTGFFAETLKRAGLRVVTLIHELPEVIRNNNLQRHAVSIAKYSDRIVFPSVMVAEGFRLFAPIEDERVVLRPQGVYKRNPFRSTADRAKAQALLRARLGIPEENKIVLCVGYADRRKGIDLFIDMAFKVLESNVSTTFIWLGHWDTNLESEIRKRVSDSGHADHFVFPGLDLKTDIYFAGSDIYTLMSREDPFPSVVMESLDVAVPVIAFDGAGGFCDLLNRGCGVLVPKFDTAVFAREVSDLLCDIEARDRLGKIGQKIIEQDYSFRRYLFDLADIAHLDLKKVSVVVPNYNYAQFIEERLSSIFNQTYPIYELIVLDDCSTDSSLEIINAKLADTSVDHRVVVNEVNSGSVFRQWKRGSDLINGDFLWIAEADDSADPLFLETVIEGFCDSDVVLSYAQSSQIDDSGRLLADDYLYYTEDVSATRWLSNYTTTGLNEVREALAVKNTIPNVSGVVFQASAFTKTINNSLDTILEHRYAGDWLLYVHLLATGKVAFFYKSLNVHRRHDQGVTISGEPERQLLEIISVQKLVQDLYEIEPEKKQEANEYTNSLRSF